MTYLDNVIVWTAFKLSKKTKEQFSFAFNVAWFFNRSTFRIVWYALTEKPPKLLDQIGDMIRGKHYSIRTETQYAKISS